MCRLLGHVAEVAYLDRKSSQYELTIRRVSPNELRPRLYKIRGLLTDTVSKFWKKILNQMWFVMCEHVSVTPEFYQNGIKLDDNTLMESIIGAENIFELGFVHKVVNVLLDKPAVFDMEIPYPLISERLQPLSISKSTYTDMKKAKWRWYISSDQNTWQLISRKFTCTLLSEHVGKYLKLKCIPADGDLVGNPYEVVSQLTVQEHAGELTQPLLDRLAHTSHQVEDNRLRVVSYNILSDEYVRYLKYCPRDVLEYYIRRPKIWTELQGYHADIMCLQEVDECNYDNFLRKEFWGMGFASKFNKKGNQLREGLCIAYRRSKLRIIEHNHIVLKDWFEKHPNQAAIIYHLIGSNSQVKEEFCTKLTSLQYCVFLMPKTHTVLVVANTHLYYHKDAGHIKFLQSLAVITILTKLKKKFESRNWKVSTILCGDFNSKPESCAYGFLSTGKPDKNHPEMALLNKTRDVRHSLNFASACGTPEFTNYVQGFNACLDYIFYQTNRMRLLQTVPMPSEEAVKKYIAIPSYDFPSDHLALVADLEVL